MAGKIWLKCKECGSVFEYVGYGRPATKCPTCAAKKRKSWEFVRQEEIGGDLYNVYKVSGSEELRYVKASEDQR